MGTILELAELPAAAYLTAPVPSGWTKLTGQDGSSFDPKTGFFAEAFQNTATGEIVIANRGTVPNVFSTLWTDAQLAVGQLPKAALEAEAFAIQVALDHPL